MDEDEGQGKAPSPERRKGKAALRPKKVDEGWAMRAAAHYLERYSSSSENLKKVLQRKALKRLMEDRLDEAVFTIIDQAVARMTELGFLDDERYAAQKAGALRRKGASSSRISRTLAARGVDRETVSQAISDEEMSEEQAARRLAQRRHLGPWRRASLDDLSPMERRKALDKEMATLCRAGFSIGLARRVLAGAWED